ncbi:MAG TPA: hypothetical protein VFA07_12230 [Chthonomonadaceae bacterium]|nr:hypothetical protein [Chthonomonadaceae bacterium]
MRFKTSWIALALLMSLIAGTLLMAQGHAAAFQTHRHSAAWYRTHQRHNAAWYRRHRRYSEEWYETHQRHSAAWYRAHRRHSGAWYRRHHRHRRHRR